jgi:hypothetical protein
MRATVAAALAEDTKVVITGVFRASHADAGRNLTADATAKSHYLEV